MIHEDGKPIYFKSDGDAVIEDLALLSFLDISIDPASQGFLSNLSNMSRVVESFIVFERLFVFHYKTDDENDFALWNSLNPIVLASIIETLTKEGVLNFVQPLPIGWVPQPSAMLAQTKELNILPSNIVAKFNEHRIGYYLFQQEVSRKSDIPFICSDSDYSKTFIKQSTSIKQSLAQQLTNKIDLAISKDVEDLIQVDNEINFYVPPFLAIVLEKVIHGASFGEAILEMREKFRPLRLLFAKYNNIFRDDSRLLRKQISDSRKILSDIDRISSSFSTRDKSSFTIWRDAFDLVVDSAPNLEQFNVVKSSGILPRLLKLSKDVLRAIILKRRYSSVYKLKKDFHNIKGYGSLVQRSISPTYEKAKLLFPEGHICISPGNPFGDPRSV